MKNIDPTAMADVLDYFRGQEALSAARVDPYVLSHPLTRDRIRAVKGYAAAYAGSAKDDPSSDYWFARAKGKLGAFLQARGFTLRKVAKNDNSDIAVMRRAIAYHRAPRTEKALARDQQTGGDAPAGPFCARIAWPDPSGIAQLFRRRRAYGRAVNLAPKDALILAGYGRALLALTPTPIARPCACWNRPAAARRATRA